MTDDLRRSLELLTDPSGVFEVRALGRWTASGYYDPAHIDKAAGDIEALEADPDVKGIYVTLNAVNPALIARRANRIETRLGKDATTADADIIRRRWLLVDLDPIRASGISSTDEEHTQALGMAGRVAEFLKSCFEFPAPVIGDSGNGAHLLYRIDLPNDDESKSLITRCLKAISAAFCGQGCDIDQTVFNAARISKLYGTLNRKGDNTQDRPHRRARLITVPDPIEVVPREALDRLAGLVETEEEHQPTTRATTNTGRPIDLRVWLDEHRAALPTFQEKTKAPWEAFYIFDVCPWDSSHRDRSAWVGQLPSGALAAGCHHNGCSGRDWYALRDLVGDPRPKTTVPVPRAASGVQQSHAVQPAAGVLDVVDLFEIDPKTGKIHLKYAKVADYIRERQPLVAFKQRLWVYDGRRYIENAGHIEALIQETTRAIGYVGSISPVKREVLSYLRDTGNYQEYPFDQAPGFLPVQNGILHITGDSVRLLPHGPEHLFTYTLAVAYDPAAPTSFIEGVFSDWANEDAGVLVQVPAQCILQAWGGVYKAAYLFEGRPNAGKTTYCDLLYALFGEQCYSKVGLGDLLENRFATAELLGRMLNVQDDLPYIPLKSIGTFKDLTGGIQHRIERKHENGFKTTIRAVHLFTCNKPPEIKDTNDRAFWERWMYVIWANAFPVDPTFQRRLTAAENLSALLNLAIAKVQAVLRGDEHIERMDPDDTRNMWTAGSSPVVAFVAANFTRDAQAEIPKDQVYEAYARHCQAASTACLPKNIFSGELARLGIIGCRSRDGRNRVQAYRGIVWKSDAPDQSSCFGQGGQGIFSVITHRKNLEDNIHMGKLPLVDPDHPDQDNDPREAATHSTDPTDYQTLPRPDFGQRCAVCGCQGVQHREKPADFNRRRGTAGLCAACFENLGTTKAPAREEEHIPGGAA